MRRLTGHYALILGCFWANFAILSNYASVYLLERGIQNTVIGLMFAVASLTAAVLQTLLGAYADRPQSASVKRLFLYGICIFFVFTAGILLVGNRSAALLILFYGLAMMSMQGMMGLANSLGTLSARAGNTVNFGIARGTGSFVFAVAALVVGRAIESLGTGCVPPISICVYAALFLSVLLFPFAKEKAYASTAKKGGNFFRKYPSFIVFLIAIMFLYTSHSMINNFMFQILASKGGDSTSLGIASAIGAIVEIPMMFLFTRLLRRIPAATWLVICGFAFLVKTVGSLLVPNVLGFYGMQVLQILAFAVLAVASVYYADATMAPEDASKGQALLVMTSTVGSVIASAFGGWLLDASGVTTLLITASVAAGLGAVILCAVLTRRSA